MSKLARNGPMVRFTGVILKRKVNFLDVSLLERCLVVNPDNFFIAKSDPNLNCVASERVKNMEI